MLEVPPMYSVIGVREVEGDFVNVDIKEKMDRSAPLQTLRSTQTCVETSSLERQNNNVVTIDGLYRKNTVKIGPSPASYKLYKRRWMGLMQLVLLNLLFGWNWHILFPITEIAAKYFQASKLTIYALNLSFTASLSIFSPLVVWVLHRYGCHPAFVITGLALALGSLVQYAATIWFRIEVFVLAKLIIGAGASFSTIMPTHYSDLWFSPMGRMSATALAILAFPVGSGIGQLVSPLVDPTAQSFPSMTLIASIVSVIVLLGALFITAKPPTPSSASCTFSKMPLLPAFVLLIRSKNFWLFTILFALYFGSANATFCLLDQVFTPYHEYAWVCGAIFISGGLVTGCILIPIVTRYRMSLTIIRVLCPIIGLCYLALIWVPSFRTPLLPFFIAAILGGASFSLLPIILEYVVDIMHPIAPESTSSLIWVTGLLLGAWCTGIMEIIAVRGAGDSQPSMKNSLIFQAVIALAVVPIPFCISSRATNKHIGRC